MRSKALWLAMSAAFVVAAAPPSFADDGERLVRNVSSSPGTTEDPGAGGRTRLYQADELPRAGAVGEWRSELNTIE